MKPAGMREIGALGTVGMMAMVASMGFKKMASKRIFGIFLFKP